MLECPDSRTPEAQHTCLLLIFVCIPFVYTCHGIEVNTTEQ